MSAKWPIGVFTSVGAGLGVDLVVARELGIPTVQLHTPPVGQRDLASAQQIKSRLVKYDIRITAVFGGFAGESYESIPVVVDTVGLVPKNSRASRLAEMREISDFAKHLDCSVIALHLGFVPHDTEDPDYQEVIDVTRSLCEYAHANGQSVHLETGQETAEALARFIEDTGCENLFVNFDPANMILYGAGDPIEAVTRLGNLIRSVHCKDAQWAASPGQEWGVETKLGDGDVGMETFLRTLNQIGYEGPLTIEREIPQTPEKQRTEIGHAVNLLNQLKRKLS